MPAHGKKDNDVFWHRQNLIADAPLTNRQKWALQVLFIFAGCEDDGVCFASNAELQRRMSLKSSQMYAVLADLAERGLIANETHQRRIHWDRLAELICPESRNRIDEDCPENRNPIPESRTHIPESRNRTLLTSLRTSPLNIPTTEDSLSFPIRGGKEWILSEDKLAEYKATYQVVDVAHELKHARQWCIDNKSKRKTASGMPRFLNAWLMRAQQSPRQKGSSRDQRTDSGQVFDRSRQREEIVA